MIRGVIVFFAFVSLFMVPWLVAAAMLLVVAVMVPVAGLLLGVIADVVYYSPGSAFMPYFTLFGIIATIFSLLVQRFVKTRIMEG